MFKKSKRLLGLCLGVVLSLGVGVGLGTTHGEAVGVKAADEVEEYSVVFYKGNQSNASTQINTSTKPNTIIKTNSDKISGIGDASNSYYATSSNAGKGGIRIGKSEGSGKVQFKLTTALVDAYRVEIASWQVKTTSSCTLSVGESNTAAQTPATASGSKYSFLLDNYTTNGLETLTINTSSQLWVESFTLYTKTPEPEVTGVTLSPSDEVTLAVGKSKTFTIGILGDNLTGSETVTASYEEIMLDNSGVTIDKTEGLKDGDEITATATIADAGGTLTIKYNDSISASVDIYTEAAKTPTKLEYTGTPITSYIAGQSFDPTGLSFKVYYGAEDTTGTDVDAEHIAFNPSTLNEDTTSVTGSYTENEETVSFTINDITVEADYIVDVEFDTSSAKTEYNIGETWVNEETEVYGIGSYKVSTEDMLEIYAKDFTYSGYDLTKSGKQTITVSYPNPKSETPFSTTYIVTVKSETLEIDGVYEIVTDYSSLKSGDKIVIAENTVGAVSGDLAKKTSGAYDTYLTSVSSSTFSSDKKTITSLGEGALVFTLSGDSTAWHLLNDDGDMLGATAAKKLTWDSTSNNFNSNWTFSSLTETVSDVTYTGTAITNGGKDYGRILYNARSGQERFLNYTSDVSKDMLIPKIYKFTGGTHDASLALVNTVKSIYNDGYLSCDTNGANSTIKWTEITNLFSSNVTDADELEFLKEASSDETAANGTIKKFLADYDYILSKYNSAAYSKGYADFLQRNPTSSASSISRISYASNNNTAILIVVLVSFASIAAIGGYFFIRKRRYN